LPEGVAAKRPDGEAVAYLCIGTTCSAPITRFEDLERALTPAGRPDAERKRTGRHPPGF
jgi:hypothetical protein